MSKGSVITERDVQEATCVTSRGEGHQFEIQLGHLCNNRCVFCSSGQLTQLKLAKPIPLEPILAAIEGARAKGARRVTFLGGEPTLHKGFLAALKHSVELGFPEIVIFTNGVLLPQPGFVDSVVALGNFEWRISIQGGNEEAHVAVTKRKYSFQKIVDGLRLLRAKGQRVTANMCVNEESYRSLPDYPALIKEHGIRQLHVDIVRPSSAGERSLEYIGEIVPKYSTMVPYMREMLERFERDDPSFDVNIGNMPLCVLPEWAHRIHHGGEQTVTTACDETELEVELDKYEWHASQRRHLSQCAGCTFRPECTGIFSTYLEIHGGSEFQPISMDRLRELDPAQRNFVRLLEPTLAPWLRAELPDGWHLDEISRSAHERRIELHMHSDGGAATIRFSPAARRRGDEPDASTKTFSLDINVDAGVSREELLTLLPWIERELGVVAPDAKLAIERIRRRHHTARLEAHGRVRIAQLVARIEQRQVVDGWHVGASRNRTDAPGAVIEVRGPSDARVDVVFEIVASETRMRVTVDFALAPGTDVEAARPVVEEIIRVLDQPREPASRP